MLNAGLRLWETQKSQGTGLCIGLDPHYDSHGPLNEAFYRQYATRDHRVYSYFKSVIEGMPKMKLANIFDHDRVIMFLAGVARYMAEVADTAWHEGIRVFKPQIAHYERLHPFGMMLLGIICQGTRWHVAETVQKCFLILDCKRGDIAESQAPYYEAYLTDLDKEVFPGSYGQFGFDVMTVTTWMGEDVLTPGLPFFRNGKGAIVVTRSSNPSGTTFQDALVHNDDELEVSGAQEPFCLTPEVLMRVEDLLGKSHCSAHEVMLYLTSEFSRKHDLDEEGVSPLFSVMGSTVKMESAFRELRPGGIALVPGFGAQEGQFANVMPLVATAGVLEGHLGILSSSRAHNYPWMEKYGGSGDPKQLKSDMARAIAAFRKQEKEAYAAYGIAYPF